MLTKEIYNQLREELDKYSENFSDEEIINGVVFQATVLIDGVRYTATTEPTDGLLDENATEEEVAALIDKLCQAAAENPEIEGGE